MGSQTSTINTLNSHQSTIPAYKPTPQNIHQHQYNKYYDNNTTRQEYRKSGGGKEAYEKDLK